MLVVNNTDTQNPQFNVFDQYGSLIDRNSNAPSSWYSASKVDKVILDWVAANTGENSDTTTLTPLKHK